MAEILFYHLERARVEDVLPSLLERCLERSWQSLILVPDASAQARLDDWLWTYTDESFLPHAALVSGAGEGPPADIPILLGVGPHTGAGFDVLFVLAGVTVYADQLAMRQRACLLFDGTAAAAARDTWKAAKAAGHAVSYWRQNEDGRWEKTA